MPHSTSTAIDRSRIYLVLDQGRDDIGDTTKRRALGSFHHNLAELEWIYYSSAGGFGPAVATIKIEEGTWARAQLAARNYSTAYIYWAPPETEGPVQMADFDSHEGEFLLWMGAVADVEVSPKSDLVRVTMLGLGEFMEKASATRETNIIRSIKGNAEFNSNGLEGDSWILDNTKAYQALLNDGAMLKEVVYTEGWADYLQHTQALAELIGGHPQVAFGIRNAGGADDLGQFYFTMVADPGREQTSSVAEFNERQAPSISPLEVLEVSVEDDTSSLINAARVFVPYNGGFLIREGTAENAASVARYGRREVVVPDTSVSDQTQAADRAAAMVAGSSSPEVLVSASFLHDPRPVEAPTAAGETYLPLLTALKAGDRKIPIPFQERSSQDRSKRGDVVNGSFELNRSDVIQTKKSATAGSCVLVDCRTGSASKSVPDAPTGIYSAAPDVKAGGDMNGSTVLYHIQTAWSDSSELLNGSGATKSCAVWELDRMLYLAMGVQGTTPQTYVPALYYCDGVGNWNSVGAWTVYFGSTIAKTDLTGGVDIFISLGASIGGTELASVIVRVYRKSASKDDPAGLRTLLWYGSINITTTSVIGTAGNRAFFVGKNEGSGPVDQTGVPALSKSMDIYQVQVYGNLGEDDTTIFTYNGLSTADFCDELAYQQPPYKHANKLLLDLHNGCHRDILADDVSGLRTVQLIHVCYIDNGTHTDGGDFAHLFGDVAGTEVSELAPTLTRKHNTWLLGPGSTGYASAMGPDLTVAPREIVCRLQGDLVAIDIEGNARPLSASYAIKVAGEEIDKAFRSQRFIPTAQ
jgi:hypothetical protein